MKTVLILMSTYNGEQYLEEQINSLIKQEDVELKIVVRDDGSTDNTIKILRNYKKQGLLEFIEGSNFGYKKSFLLLCNQYRNKADYYAFSDQDDYWEPRKVITAINELEKENKKYKLYFSNLTVVNKDLQHIGTKDFSFLPNTLGSAMMRSNVAGCSMVFNNELLNLALKNEEIINDVFSHDSWIYKVCLSVGGAAIFDRNSYIKYRQHGNNVTGISQGMKKRITSVVNGFTTNKGLRRKSALLLIKEYRTMMPKENEKLLHEITEYPLSISKTIKLFKNNDLKFGKFPVDFIGKCAILLRKF